MQVSMIIKSNQSEDYLRVYINMNMITINI